MTWEERCLNQDDMRWVVAVLKKAVAEGETDENQWHLREFVRLLGKTTEKKIRQKKKDEQTRFLFNINTL